MKMRESGKIADDKFEISAWLKKRLKIKNAFRLLSLAMIAS
jgi:hypothetical protein